MEHGSVILVENKQTSVEHFGEEMGHRRLKAWVSAMQHLGGSKEGQDVEMQRHTGSRGPGKGSGTEVRMHTVGMVKVGQAAWLDVHLGLCRHCGDWPLR